MPRKWRLFLDVVRPGHDHLFLMTIRRVSYGLLRFVRLVIAL